MPHAGARQVSHLSHSSKGPAPGPKIILPLELGGDGLNGFSRYNDGFRFGVCFMLYFSY